MGDDDDFNNRRKEQPGRRAEDYLYESLVERLRGLERRLERTIDKFEEAIGKLVEQVKRSEGEVHQRVDELEDYHIEEQAKVRTRIADRAKQLENWQKGAIFCTFLSALCAIVAVVISLTN